MVLLPTPSVSLAPKVSTALLKVWAQLMATVTLVTSVLRVPPQPPRRDALMTISALRELCLRFRAPLVSSPCPLVRQRATPVNPASTAEAPPPRMTAPSAITAKMTDSSHVLLALTWILQEMCLVCPHLTWVNLTTLSASIARKAMAAARSTPRPSAPQVSIAKLVQLLQSQMPLHLTKRWVVCVCQAKCVVLVLM
jgi:hypothetical protein